MALTYTDLIASKSNTRSLAYLVNSTLLPAESIAEDAQALIYSRLRAREMRTTANIAITVGQSVVALPEGFLDPILLIDQAGGKIRLREEEQFLTKFLMRKPDGTLEQATVANYAIMNEALNFDCRSDAAQTLMMTFYKQPALLTQEASTNFLTRRYPHILRKACQHFAHDFLKNAAEARSYLQDTMALIEAANVEADLSRQGADYIAGDR